MTMPLRAGEDAAPLDITEFLAGRTRAHGVFEDRFGRPRRSFTVTMNGHWQGDVFVLDEDFLYDDGARERRTWRIRRSGSGQFVATAPDCVGEAHGTSAPGRWHMRYEFMLRLRKRMVPVVFDDQVYAVTDRLALNRATLSKFGVRLGQVLIVYERESASGTGARKPSLADAA
jgi:hypothetical protein